MASEDSEREPHVLEEDQEQGGVGVGVGGGGTNKVVVGMDQVNSEETSKGGNTEKKNNSKKSNKKKSSYLPKFGCFRIEHDATGKSFDMEVVDASGSDPPNHPTHLIITVNGLIGSAQNWKFAAKQFLRKYPHDAVVHCSECNSAMLTFDGVDVMGDRLANEVISVIKRHPSVQKISFVGHSLGGLVARYAIAKLYGRDLSMELSQENRYSVNQNLDQQSHDRKYEGKIAGLEPINFVTSATPHLGSRGHKQCPLFCGFPFAEKVATHASWLLGKSGKHLFLADGTNGKPPLLLQMVRDSEDLKFLSALQSFKRRVAYANVRYDKLVGWSTSSIRRRNELPKRRHLSRHERYPHIVNIETAQSSLVPEDVATGSQVNNIGSSKLEFEEEMIRSLTTMSWDRIDVSFRGTRQRILAHSTIQVKSTCINYSGADVVQHMVDNFQL